jgi:3-oxoadipate enol-lactonase
MTPRVAHREKGDGDPVVFLHGVGGDSESWQHQLAAFAAAGFRAIAWDMPGYGGSPALDPVTFPGLADALSDLLDDLDIDRAHLVGHSIGGMVAQEFMDRHAGRVRRLVLSATSPAFGRPDGDFQKKFLAARLEPLDRGETMADIARAVVPDLVGDAPDPGGVALATACMERVPADTYRATMRCLVTFDRRDLLPRIAVPTLLLAGAKDTNAPAPMMERMAGKIPGARYVCLEGAGHLAPLERPDAFNATVQRFLTG